MDNRPIGMIDSGVGGLTILKQTMKELPQESFYFLGDNARAPYGPRPVEEVKKFTKEMVNFLLEKDIKALVIACNTITAVYLSELQEQLAIPVIGVITPAVQQALNKSKTKHIGVIATEGTIASGAYEKTLQACAKDSKIYSLAAPSLVTLVEENKYHVADALPEVRQVLSPFKQHKIDTLILGCTHYPYLTEAIQLTVGPNVHLVDASTVVPKMLYDILKEANQLADNTEQSREITLFTTSSVEKFGEIAQEWLDTKEPMNITRVSLKGDER